MYHDKCLWTIPFHASYVEVRDYINNPNGATPKPGWYADMIAFSQMNIKNGHISHVWHQGFYNATKPGSCAGAPPFAVPGTIQAEEYCRMYYGVQTEQTTDAGGGSNVGFLDAGDYLEYNINVATAGQYIFSARVASIYSTGQINIQANGVSLGLLSIPNTNGWQRWYTRSMVVTLTAGLQRLRLSFPNGGFNINSVSFELSTSKPTSKPASAKPTSRPSSKRPIKNPKGR